MTIDRIGYTDPIQPGKKTGRNESANQNSKSDSINLSSEAIEKSELYRAIEVASTAPDVRADLVAEMKAKINDPSYLNDRILQSTADKIIEAFGL
jgi:negative regulator of flagellin synthesis FlgM